MSAHDPSPYDPFSSTNPTARDASVSQEGSEIRTYKQIRPQSYQINKVSTPSRASSTPNVKKGTIAIKLKSVQFRKEREHLWKELEKILIQIDQSHMDEISEENLIKLPMLYRSAMSSLSVARSISLDHNLVQYLETLCARAYFRVYGTRQSFGEALKDFFTRTVVESFEQYRRYILLSTGIFLLGACVAFWATLSNMEHFYLFIAPDFAQGRDPGASTESLRATLYNVEQSMDDLTYFASYLFTHNTKVGLLCIASGIFIGIPVVYLIFMNGLVLGAFVALFYSRGLFVDVMGWLLPHGITEIFAIILCGAVGMMIGHSLLVAREYSRVDQLTLCIKKITPLIIISVLMLLAAGLIEGIFRQRVTNIEVRYIFASVTAVFWLSYFGIYRRYRLYMNRNRSMS